MKTEVLLLINPNYRNYYIMATGNDVKKLRHELRLTQKELAEKIGVSIKTIANYEAGGVIPMNKQLMIEGLLSNARSSTSQIVVGNGNIANTGILSEPSISYGTDIYTLKKRIKELEVENEQLKKDKAMLQDFVAFLQNKK